VIVFGGRGIVLDVEGTDGREARLRLRGRALYKLARGGAARLAFGESLGDDGDTAAEAHAIAPPPLAAGRCGGACQWRRRPSVCPHHQPDPGER
jgi:hypothetical protein